MNNQKSISLIAVILIIVGVLVLTGVILAWQNQKEKLAVCTQDAKLCSDGSYVSRTGANCEFASCPEVKDETADWKTYTNTEYGLELKYPPTWKVQEKVTGFGFWVNPPDFKMPSGGAVNPFFSFDVTAHMYLGDEKPVIKKFGTQTGYMYAKDQSVYFPSSIGVVGGYFIKLYTLPGVDEPNQILSTFRFTDPAPTPKPSPTPIPSGEKIIRKVGEKENSFLIQKINPSNVEGLWFDVYPIERPNDPGTPKTLYIGDDIGYACEGVSEKLISINFSGQTITFNKVVGQAPYGGCPICLAGNSLIDTPSGLALVKDLQIGMSVWTMDKTGQRVSGVITKTSKVPVPQAHQMVHLVLSDGRELFVSPGHPTITGRAVGNLSHGDLYDGVSVVNTERVPYGENATYDILPSGDTGFYWANGILIGSTLH